MRRIAIEEPIRLAVFEKLEPRILFSASFSDGIWEICGDVDPDSPSDEIVVEIVGPGSDELAVRVNGEIVDTQLAAEVSEIIILAGEGDDLVDCSLGPTDYPGWDTPDHWEAPTVIVYGGPGDDVILGGTADDLLVGGDGDDTLDGRAGDDLLLGGRGADRLLGGAGDDMLDGGDGEDTIDAGQGIDWVYADPSDAVIDPGPQDVSLYEASHTLIPVDSTQRLRQWTVRGSAVRYPETLEYGLWTRQGLVTGSATAATDTFGLTRSLTQDTNVQEEGVDENDLVKTDGTYLYVISGGELVILDADPESGLAVLSRTPLPDGASEMYVHAGRVAIVSGPQDWSQSSLSTWVGGWRYGGWCAPVFPSSVVTILDVSDPTSPALVQRTELDGVLFDTRMVGSRLVVAVSQPNTADWLDDFDAALPGYSSFGPDQGLLSSGTFFSAGPMYLRAAYCSHTLILMDFDVTRPVADPSTVSVATYHHTLYMSTEGLYITGRSSAGTVVHKFGLGDSSIRLRASGWVEGKTINQFAMDEHQGYFRIATQFGSWGAQLSNNLWILAQSGDELTLVGSVTGLAIGEYLRSVRFTDDLCYMVTFKKHDPFWTIDLSDPANPVVLGELVIPGYSFYLHPADEDHIIGVGLDVNPNTNLWTNMQLSLFDVSDLSNPERIDHYVFSGQRQARTELGSDHHAFAYYADEGLLVLPVATEYGDSASLSVFHVDFVGGFTPLGEIEHPTDVRRSLRIGQVLYSFSSDMVQAHDMADPTQELASVTISESDVAPMDPVPYLAPIAITPEPTSSGSLGPAEPGATLQAALLSPADSPKQAELSADVQPIIVNIEPGETILPPMTRAATAERSTRHPAFKTVIAEEAADALDGEDSGLTVVALEGRPDPFWSSQQG